MLRAGREYTTACLPRARQAKPGSWSRPWIAGVAPLNWSNGTVNSARTSPWGHASTDAAYGVGRSAGPDRYAAAPSDRHDRAAGQLRGFGGPINPGDPRRGAGRGAAGAADRGAPCGQGDPDHPCGPAATWRCSSRADSAAWSWTRGCPPPLPRTSCVRWIATARWG